MTLPGPKSVGNYDEVLAALREMADHIGLSMVMLDEMTGLPSGYSGKVFGPSRVKLAGMFAFFLYSKVLCLKVQLVPDLEAFKAMEGKWERRDEVRRRTGVIRRPMSPELLKKAESELARVRGSKAKQFRIPPDKRSKINRRNARKGWKTRRARVIRPSECPPLSPGALAPRIIAATKA